MALIGRLKDKSSLLDYFHQIEQLRDWFKKSFLALNFGKTKDLMCGKCGAICLSQQEVDTLAQ